MWQKFVCIGRVGKEPSLSYTDSGTARCWFSVAVNSNSANEKETTWFNVTAWGKTAEFCKKHVMKGKRVLISGTIKLYVSQNNSAQIQINASDVQIIDWGDTDNNTNDLQDNIESSISF